MKKRVMSILLCLIMTLGMLPTVAFAEGETTAISVVKQWSDTNHETERPESIIVNLLADGTKVDSLTISADANGKWAGTFTGKPVKNSAGETISYTVAEEAVANYTASYTAPTSGSAVLDNWRAKDMSQFGTFFYPDGYVAAISFLVGSKGSNYYIWSKQSITEAQESLVINAVNSKAAFTGTLTTENTTFVSGTSATIPGVFSVKPSNMGGGGIFTQVIFDMTNLVDAAYDADLSLNSNGGVDYWTITNTFSSEKADPTVPTGLSGVKGNALSTVALPEGWTWVDGTTVMNSSGNQTFKANYTDATGTYNNLTNVDVTVNVVSVNYGKSYDHIDVKVDGKYSVNVDGTEYTIDGTLQSNTIKVQIGTTTYDFSRYSVNTQSEGNRNEYEIKTNISPSSIAWGNVPYQMSNVVVSARMLFATVPDALTEILPTTTIGQTTYYYADITDMQYTGVQECTGGKGMRSEGKSGTPTGLDLYITAEGAGIYITKGKLAIEKVIVNEAGTAITDNTAFTFTVKSNDAGNDYNKTVTVKGGETYTLTDLTPGSYTVTETQQTGYAIRSIDGEATTNYSKDYVIVAKEDTAIPVATFTNTKLTEQSSVNIKKTAGGLPEGTAYPNPAISIYAADAQGSKSGEALWSGTLTANGDTLYLTPLFKNGTYVVEETGAEVDGYDCTTSLSVKENGAAVQSTGMTFTVSAAQKTYSLTVDNQYTESTSIPVVKEWNDEGYEAERPDSVTVNLLANGTQVDSMTLTAEGQWTGSFTDKPVKDEKGNRITYTVTEAVPECYTAEYTESTAGSWTITNTRIPPTQVKLIAQKIMDGEPPAASAFTFELKNTEDETVQTASNDENGRIAFELSFDKAGTYTYTLSEVAGADTSILYDSTVYTAEIEVELNSDGIYEATVSYLKDGQPYVLSDADETIPVFSNTTRPGALKVSKTVSGDGADKTKAFTFTVTLMENGDPVNGEYDGVTFTDGVATFTLTDGQSKIITGLPAGYTYTVAESDNSGYTVKVNDTDETTASGTIVAAQTAVVAFDNYKAGGSYDDPDPAKVSLTATKTLDGTAPTGSSFTFTLKDENGRIVQTKSNNGGKIAFDSLYFSSIGTYKYTMEEAAGTDSSITYDKAVYTVIITVTKSGDYHATVSYEKDGASYSDTPAFANTTKTTPPVDDTVSVSVKKVWKDNKSDSRPSSVSVQLYRDGKAYGDAVTLNKSNNWSYTWSELDDDYTWTVDEVNVPKGYTRSVSHSGNNWTITNSKPVDRVPQTGDNSNTTLWIALACLSAAGLLVAVCGRKRLNRRRG